MPKGKKESTLEIPKEQARLICLEAQGLLRPASFGSGKGAVLRALSQIGYVQIDTISVVQRAHHHVIWSRVPDYRPEWLHELQAQEGKILEYWSHAAAYLPMEDYRFCLPRMIAKRRGEWHWFEKNSAVMKTVLRRIRKEGPLQARHFEAPEDHQGGSWFEWKPAKQALEQLFQEGRLMVRERKGFQKVYDLPERILPAGVDTSIPKPREFTRHLIESSLRAFGIASAREVAYLRRNQLAAARLELKALVKTGAVIPARIEGIDGEFFVTRETAESWSARAAHCLRTLRDSRRVHILSPFDNLVIQRARLEALFDFSYQIECYVPEAKRKYGYFALPVLWGDRFIGRLDSKADREKRELIVRRICWEKDALKSWGEFRPALASSLARYADFNGCERIRIEEGLPPGLKKELLADVSAVVSTMRPSVALRRASEGESRTSGPAGVLEQVEPSG